MYLLESETSWPPLGFIICSVSQQDSVLFLLHGPLHWQIQVWADQASHSSIDQTMGWSWLHEAVCLRHRGQLSFESLTSGPFFVRIWTESFQLQGTYFPVSLTLDPTADSAPKPLL